MEVWAGGAQRGKRAVPWGAHAAGSTIRRKACTVGFNPGSDVAGLLRKSQSPADGQRRGGDCPAPLQQLEHLICEVFGECAEGCRPMEDQELKNG